MNVFKYDGTFEGLLCAVFDAYTTKIFPQALLGNTSSALCLPMHEVQTDANHAARVFAALGRKLSKTGIQRLMLGWLSDEEGSEMLLFRFIRKVFDSERLIESDFSDPDVLALNKLARKVNCERHRMLGFVRFQRTREDIYFAALEPRHNVLPLLLTHFKARFADQRWLLHDAGRHYGYYYDGIEIHSAQVEPEVDAALGRDGGILDAGLAADDEVFFRQLWRGYFQSAAVRERLNPRLQKSFMPKRYWKYMSELHERG